ncbi:TerC family protein [Ahrensia sp. R2A130]|uniref:TerC family protein n=1 Tax=Ahrensia sp. R2A130 TaxID=744979 RepID=UPI0001E0D0D0|nr:TerC family protein [Ahrensia sp. R2A130]EFL90881.1 TerC family membrane protein [Ahrensia sp. R2A130]
MFETFSLAELLTLQNFFTLLMLVLLQAVLGFDNLLYISIESKRVPLADQSRVRRMGILMAIALRIVLLFVVTQAIAYFEEPFYTVNIPGILEGKISGHSLIVLFGGAFIIYTAMKEIMHMMAVHDPHADAQRGIKSVAQVVTMIVIMNLVFSFDSILSALALTDFFLIMATAIIISGLMMLFLADRVSDFLSKNRMYEVLGLFVLFIVGIMLVSEGGHLAHIMLFGYPVEPMAKTTFYFVLVVLLLVDIVQSRYQRKLLAQKKREIDDAMITTEGIDAKHAMHQG